MSGYAENPMYSVLSKDGTFIAYDRVGEGPPVILVEGALNDLSATLPLAAFLRTNFTVFAYDRRGRGASGDTSPYSVEREIEDLDSVISAAGGSAFVFGNCSGAVLAMEAMAYGLDITALALFEPPLIVPGTRTRVANYQSHLAGLLSADRKADALEWFMREDAVLPEEHINMVRNSPMWESLLDLAPSLNYDAAVLGESTMPTAERLAAITVPTLVIDGENSTPWARATVQAMAESLPAGYRRTLQGADHILAADILAPVMAEFFGGLATAGAAPGTGDSSAAT
jgi:pimeloyl-ACP methyl ester carboxylesterase